MPPNPRHRPHIQLTAGEAQEIRGFLTGKGVPVARLKVNGQHVIKAGASRREVRRFVRRIMRRFTRT